MQVETQIEQPPDFKPNIPEHLLLGLSLRDRWLYERASIAEQQNNWLMQRAVNADRRHSLADARMTVIEERVGVHEDLRKMLTAKWSIVALVGSAIVGPICMAAFGAWLHSRWK